MKAKVASMVTTPVTESYKMKALYTAAASVFELPKYEQVLAYLESGPLPELPEDLLGTPFKGYSVGLIHSIRGSSVRIITNGEREVVVEPRRVAVFFRTATRDASTEAAREVLEYLHQHTGDEVCQLELDAGPDRPRRFVSDADIAPEEL
jgi:hypothetical protein